MTQTHGKIYDSLMSFVDGFYSYTLEITNSERETYVKVRVKTPKHPLESLEHLNARTLAFAHSYREGSEFTQGYYAPEEPTIQAKDILGAHLLWAQLGTPERKKLERALRYGDQCEYRVYFLTREDIDSFCHLLRGSRQNWIEHIHFYLIDQTTIAAISEHPRSSSHWQLTVDDETIYLTIDERDYETRVLRIDMWSEFQASIENTL